MSAGLRRAGRAGPVTLAAALAGAYLIWSPVSVDLAAHLFRAKLFTVEGFGIWDNSWYAGHHTPGYSVLFPPVAAAVGPQLAAALAVVGTTALFEPLARRHFGEDAWIGALWFAVGAATNLLSGRLTFAFGLLPAVAAVLALSRGYRLLATSLCAITALASPVAALFTALAGLAYSGGGVARDLRSREFAVRRTLKGVGASRLPGLAVAIASLAPVVILAVAFPEGGTEPFAFSALWPIPVFAVFILVALPRDAWTLRLGAILYTAGCVLAYAIPTAVGSNATRLGALLAGPLAALVLWRRHVTLLVLAALPLLYIQTQAAVRDVQAGGPATTAAYYRPLLGFLARQPAPPFRIEIPFTAAHWESYEVAPRFALARGWERQLDIKDNSLFYNGTLSASSYQAWLHRTAVRYVAVADVGLDYSARAEVALIDRGLPYLHLVWHGRHWRVFAVADPAPIVRGAALRKLTPDSLTIDARAPGRISVRVHFTPYWALSGGSGCVAPDGDFTRLTLRHAGEVRLVIRFALDRIGARSPRCSN
ncbi:MAG: hypothetical protein M3065_01410 [Actinomycetota bacterium]|nr:hypothetical protein [Actinomycetota bacterium]